MTTKKKAHPRPHPHAEHSHKGLSGHLHRVKGKNKSKPQWKGIIGKGFTKEEFKAYVASIKWGVWKPQFITIHNTEAPRLADWHKYTGQQHMNGFTTWYRDEQGWSAGPHLFVADDLIWVFTPLTVPGVHSPSWNLISWGVEIVGDYDTEKFADGVKDNAISAVATLCAARGLNPDTIRFHKEDPKTTHKGCPGRALVKKDFIQAVKDRMAVRLPGEHLADRGTKLEEILAQTA